LILYAYLGKENSLRLESTEPKLYAFGEEPSEAFELCLSLPSDRVSWMVVLKVSCLEGNEMATHPKHYWMKVLKGKNKK
jgi:hypothetical protein